MITLPFGSTPYYRVISHRRQEISGVYNALRYLNKKKKLVDERERERERPRTLIYRYHAGHDSRLEPRIVSFHVSVVARIVLIIV